MGIRHGAFFRVNICTFRRMNADEHSTLMGKKGPISNSYNCPVLNLAIRISATCYAYVRHIDVDQCICP